MPTLIRSVTIRRANGTFASFQAGQDPGAADGAYIQAANAWEGNTPPYPPNPTVNNIPDGSIIQPDLSPELAAALAGGGATYDTLANRPTPAAAGDKKLFVATTTGDIYQVQAGAWVKIGGSSGTSIATGFSGPLAQGVTTGRYYAQSTGTSITATASLVTAGTTASVFTVKKNGVSIGTITLNTGVVVLPVTIATPFTIDTDYFTVELTTAGAGAAGATIQLRMT